MERQTKGIWIPIEIWESKELTWNEKILFLEIDSFTSKDKDCFFSNEYIANLLGVTENSANRILSSLISKGYVIKTAFDGRRRFIKTAYSYDKADYSQMNKLPNQESSSSSNDGEYIPNNSNNTGNKPNKQEEEKEWRDSFEVYLEIVNNAKDKVLLDTDFRQYIEKYYPNSDYNATLNKLVDGFWGKEEGWEYNKSKKKVKSINMVSTLKKNMDKRERIVYKQRDNRKKYTPLQNKDEELNNNIPTLNEDGDLPDGTFYKGGKRWYISEKDGRPYSIPLKAPNRPDKRSEWSVTKKSWYIPLESWEASDELW